jgi:hypothetical protein
MPLVDLEIPVKDETVPADVYEFLRIADRRIQEFLSAHADQPVAGFVQSDFVRVYHALRAIKEGHLAAGETFCEWGSGFGVAACLAARLGFDASGIEIDAELVDSAEQLADDFEISVTFAHGTFVPPDGERFTDSEEDLAWLQAGGACGYESLGVELDELDVIFAYPWPGEASVISHVFEHFAADGALLLTYHGYDDMRLRRKVG